MSGDEPGGFALHAMPGGGQVGRFDAMEALGGLAHAVTTRRGFDVALAGAAPSAAARLVADQLGLEAVAFCRQVHAADVLRVDSGGMAGEADGLVTDRPSLGVMGFSADCPLILAADSAGAGVGMAHASWRGTVRGIAGRLVAALAGELGANPAKVVACICPAAGPCCYEVGDEVRAAAARALGARAERFFRPRGAGKFLFDLWAANRDQLLAAGLSPDGVHTAGVCTICRNDLFPSYRVEGDSAGRFVAVIARTPRP